ncbi:hypothetical protein [Mesorhizobium sp. M1322]|uniref:hypothetical protein n=1 Tax=Mesorhizobium sp. M1322 TaxID=2957081 RepID=UPI0033377EDE
MTWWRSTRGRIAALGLPEQDPARSLAPKSQRRGWHPLAKIKLKHYVIRKGKYGYWLPTPKMVEAGFECISCGLDGPDAWAIAKEWEDRWQAFRKGREVPRLDTWPKDSIGDAFARYRRMEAWKSRLPRTREDWERGWTFIEPYFADLPPADITLELLDEWYARLLRAKGIDVAYRAMKTWRALYNVMAGMKLCAPRADPSLAIRRKTPNRRTQVWSEGERCAWSRAHGAPATAALPASSPSHGTPASRRSTCAR